MSLARTGKLAFVRREQDQFRIDRFDGARDCVGEIRIPYRHVVQGAVRFDVIWLHIQCGGDRLKNSKLISHRVEHFFGGYRQLLAPEILAIEKTWMRSDGNSLVVRRGNGGVHRIGIASVKTGRDIRRADQVEKLCVVSRAFAEVGVQIDRQFHALWRLKPMRKRSKSRSRFINSRCASCSKTSENRTLSPARSCAAMPRSTVITWAIFGYPPMVWQSPKSKIGLPLGGTWIVPGATASEIRSVSCLRLSSGPSRRTPIRSESGETLNSLIVNRFIVASSKRLQSTPRMKRKTGYRFAGLTQSCGPAHEEIGVGGGNDPGRRASGTTPPPRNVRPSSPPKFARRSVERLPRTTGTSMPPEIASQHRHPN